MGNTCVIGPAFAAEEGSLEAPASMTTQRSARTAVINDEAVETILLDSTAVEAEDDGQSPRRRSKGRKGTGYVRKEDLEQEEEEEEEEPTEDLPQEEEEPTEGQPQPTKRGGRKATGFVFKERLEELTRSEDESEGETVAGAEGVEGDDGDAANGNGKKVLINEGVNENFWLKDKEDETDEPQQLKRTSERKPTGKAVRLSPQELDEIRHGVRIEPSQEGGSAATPASAAATGPVLLAAPAPKRRGRKPTGRPTEEQLEKAHQQEEAEAALKGASAPRQKVRKDTPHPSADGKRARAKRVLAKMFRA